MRGSEVRPSSSSSPGEWERPPTKSSPSPFLLPAIWPSPHFLLPTGTISLAGMVNNGHWSLGSDHHVIVEWDLGSRVTISGHRLILVITIGSEDEDPSE